VAAGIGCEQPGKLLGTLAALPRKEGPTMATVFFGEHLPRIQGQVEVGDDASFVDAPRPRP
jgi:hypothetical protein